jgi:hypothetical protein
MFAGDAVLGPDTGLQPLLNSMRQQQEREYQRQQQAQQEEYERQDQLSKLIDQSFNDKNYATGGVHDGLIKNMTAEARKKYVKMIRENKSMRLADLQYMVQDDMSKLAGMSENIKGARKQIEDQSATLKDEVGVDANAVKGLALDKMLYKRDATGKKVLRSPEEIDPSFDYVSEAIKENKGVIINKTKVLGNFLKTAKEFGNEVKTELITDNKGRKNTWKVDAHMFNFQDFAKDANGNPIEVNGRPQIKTKSQVVDLGNGRKIEVLAEDVYTSMNQNTSTRYLIESEFDSWNKSQPQPVDENSKEAEIIKRKLAYDMLNIKPLRDNFTNKSEEDAWMAKQRAGVTVKVINPSDKEDDKEEKAFAKSPVSTLTKGLNLDQSVLSSATDSQDEQGNPMKNIADIAGGVVVAKKDGQDVYADEILIDPNKKGRLVVKVGKTYTEFTGKEATAFIKRISQHNGLSFDVASRKITDPVISKEDEMKERINARKKKKFDILNPFGIIK